MALFTSLVGNLFLFTLVGFVFLFGTLVAGRLIRPVVPHPEKAAIYECGEPTIGSGWIQFDLRFYVVALLFVIFDVELAFFFPWAVVFGKMNKMADPSIAADATRRIQQTAELASTDLANTTALSVSDARTLAIIAFFDLLVFFGVLLVGFAYLWKRGDLDWVRAVSTPGDEVSPAPEPATSPDMAAATT